MSGEECGVVTTVQDDCSAATPGTVQRRRARARHSSTWIIFSTQMLAWPSLDLPIAISSSNLCLLLHVSRVQRVLFFLFNRSLSSLSFVFRYDLLCSVCFATSTDVCFDLLTQFPLVFYHSKLCVFSFLIYFYVIDNNFLTISLIVSIMN